MGSLYFDNAATSYPKPECVYRSTERAFRYCGGNPGRGNHRLSKASAKIIYETREAICDLLNVQDPSKVVFAQNATAALNTAILGIPGKGGKIVISDMEHNAVLRSVAEKCRRENVKYSVFKTYPASDEMTLNSLKEQIGNDCRAIIVNAASNVDGRVLPIEKIGTFCKERNLPYIIDASQLLPHRTVDFQRLNCTFLCSAGHKGLYSPMGCGFAVLGKGAEDFAPLLYGGNGVNSADLYINKDLPERFECGTLPVPAISGLKAGIDYIQKQGPDNLNYASQKITSYILERLLSIKDVSVYHAKNECPVISIRIKNRGCEEIAEALAQRGIAVRAGLHCAPLAHSTLGTLSGGTVRISPSFMNTENDARLLIKTICELK